MQKTCKQCNTDFQIAKEDLVFYDKISPLFNGKKYPIPPPQLCPDCRLQRRLAFRNERNFYHRKCDLSGKQTLSMYSDKTPFQVYEQAEWWGDKWDALTYGRDFDFNRSFFEQFFELFKAVPRVSLYTTNIENSYYNNFTINQKDCYLIHGGGNNEKCMYGNFVTSSEYVLDALSVYSCRYCYEGVSSGNCYQCFFFTNCRSCSDSIMIEDCQNCQNCIACFGLRQQEYCIMNTHVGKEKFEKAKKELFPLTAKKIGSLREKLNIVKAKSPHIASHVYNSEDCSGDMIFNSKNCQYCFDTKDSEDSKYLNFTPKGMASQDCTFNASDGVEYCFNTCSTVGAKNSMATFLFWYGDRVYYSMECFQCKDLFGCIGLKHKEYCIFNKQYTKEEYEELAPKIIEHMQKSEDPSIDSRSVSQTTGQDWGDFFPIIFSPFGYNETIAQEYFPLTKEKVLAQGWKWKDEEERVGYKGPEVKIPEQINDVDDSVCEKVLTCEISDKNYKIIPQELEFYRKMDLPIPRKSPTQRHQERLKLRNPRKLWSRNCMKCNKEMLTVHAPDRPETVYCEECYLKEVY